MAGAAAIAFVAGAVIGSLITVIAHRVPRGEGFVTGRSRCPGCGAQIAAYDNVPIVSWLLLRGRCRHCGAPISARYPLTEAGLGALWAGTVLALGTDDAGELVLGLVLCAVLVAITLTDLELRIIPNAFVLAGAIAGLAIVLAFDLGDLDQRAIAIAAAGGAFFLIALVYPRGMGMGDAKLVAMMALYLGRSIAPGGARGPDRGLGGRGGDHRPAGLRGAQAGGPVRAVPGARRRRRTLVRRRHRRLVPGHVHGLSSRRTHGPPDRQLAAALKSAR